MAPNMAPNQTPRYMTSIATLSVGLSGGAPCGWPLTINGSGGDHFQIDQAAMTAQNNPTAHVTMKSEAKNPRSAYMNMPQLMAFRSEPTRYFMRSPRSQ